MALTNREQKMLDEIEHKLAAEDPRLATRLSQEGIHGRLIHFVLSGLFTVGLGIVLMLLSLNIGSVALGAGAFILSVAGVYIAMWPIPPRGLRLGARRSRSDSPLESS
ncbi:MAG: DUF3040 domain-containing protein [Specibacter sp.]